MDLSYSAMDLSYSAMDLSYLAMDLSYSEMDLSYSAMDLSQKIPRIYTCELCDYHTNESRDYNKHLVTNKHIINDAAINVPENPTQTRKIFTCELCDYHTYVNKDYAKHLTTKKHISKTNSPDTVHTKSKPLYTCETCEYHTYFKKDYIKHLYTKKHKEKEYSTKYQDISGNTKHIYVCDICDKSYSDYSGLWRHKKSCIAKEEEDEEVEDKIEYEIEELDEEKLKETLKEKLKEELKEELKKELKEELKKEEGLKNEMRPFDDAKELCMELMKNNKEVQTILLEGMKMLMENMSKFNQGNTNSHNTTNTNSNNSFNLNFFLNEQCKNALNIHDFVDSLNPSFQDMERTGKVGFVEGITSIFLNGLRQLDVYSRPIHCTDLKRESLYVKDNDIWEKETEDKPRLRKAIKRTANKNLKQLRVWQEQHPDYVDTDTQASEDHLVLAQTLMGGVSQYESDKFEKSIMRNILKEVTIDKEQGTKEPSDSGGPRPLLS